MKSVALISATIVGAIFRFWNFDQLGLSHFDEGQYAFARVWPWVDSFDPNQPFFSPPVFPFLVGFVQWFTGPWHLAGPFVSALAGTLTIPVAAWFTESIWGQRAGILVALTVALDPMAIAFSRVGLTDATFALFVISSLFWIRAAIDRFSLLSMFLACLLGWLAWSTKYNGFLVLGVSLGFVGWSAGWTFRLARWFLIVCIVVLGVMPWFLSIERNVPGGMISLREHQAGYLRGVQAVPQNLQTAIESRQHLLGSVSRWSIPSFELLLALLAIPVALRPLKSPDRLGLMFAVLALVLLPAIYTPYLRLWLPGELLLLTIFAAGFCVACSQQTFIWKLICLLLIAGLVGWIRVPALPASPSGYRYAAEKLFELGHERKIKRMFVYVRPPLLFYLHQTNPKFEIRRIADRENALAETPFQPGDLLVVDIAVRDSRWMTESMDRLSKRMQSTRGQFSREIPMSPNLITVLDDFSGTLPENNDPYLIKAIELIPESN